MDDILILYVESENWTNHSPTGKSSGSIQMWRTESEEAETQRPAKIVAIRSVVATDTANMHDTSNVTALEKAEIAKTSRAGILAARSKEVV